MSDRFVYVGTYTEDIRFGTGEVFHGKGEGVYRLLQDTGSGRLRMDTVWRGIRNPSYLAMNSRGDRLYAVNELKEYNGAFGGAVSAFSIDNRSLQLLGQAATGGADPCHVALSESTNSLYVANFMSGSVSMFWLDSDGAFTGKTQWIQHTGGSLDPVRQQGPHAHSVVLCGQAAYVPDLGLDKVVCYGIQKDGTLLEKPFLNFSATPGSGPRHLVFDRACRFGYVINELASTVSVVQFSGVERPVPRGVYSTLPRHGSQTPTSGACIQLNASGAFLYASNRGHNSIAAFRIMGDALEQVGCYDCRGLIPRDFTLTPDDRFVLCANQSSDTITVFELDAATGSLRFVQAFAVPSPVCVMVK